MASNNYITEYVPSDFPWYERDGLMTWYDQRKCEEFLRDPKSHLKKHKHSQFRYNTKTGSWRKNSR